MFDVTTVGAWDWLTVTVSSGIVVSVSFWLLMIGYVLKDFHNRVEWEDEATVGDKMRLYGLHLYHTLDWSVFPRGFIYTMLGVMAAIGMVVFVVVGFVEVMLV